MLSLTTNAVKQLRDAQRTLLSPLDYESDEAWCLASLRAVKTVLAVDIASFALATEGDVVLLTEDFDPALFAALELAGPSEGTFATHDDDINQMQQLVYTRAIRVYDARATLEEASGIRFEDTRLYHEYNRPIGVLDPITIQACLPRGVAMIGVGNATRRRVIRVGDARWQLASLLAPFLECGASVRGQLADYRRAFTSAFDVIATPVLIFTMSGVELARNTAADSLLAGSGETAAILRTHALFAANVSSSDDVADARPRRDVVLIRSQPYVVRAAAVGAEMFAREPLVLVTLQLVMPALPSASLLTERFGLTPREAETALLLARGATNAAIAQCMGVSASTVRTHAERIFTKLRVHSRKALALVLLNAPAT